MAWVRFFAVAATSIIGLGGAYFIWMTENAPRWTIAVSGVIGLAGFAATVVLGIFAAVIISENVRPSFRFRKPVVPLSLAHQEASLVGRKRYRIHPISFWGAVTLNNRFVLGFMICDPPEYIDFKDATPNPAPEERNR